MFWIALELSYPNMESVTKLSPRVKILIKFKYGGEARPGNTVLIATAMKLHTSRIKTLLSRYV